MPTRERKKVFYQNFNYDSFLEKEGKGEEMGKWWTTTELLQFSVTSDFFSFSIPISSIPYEVFYSAVPVMNKK